MHAYLLIGQKGLKEKIKSIIGKEVKPIYFELQKIDDVRNLRSLTKYQGSNKRFFVLKDFQNASIEAMNAFLKLLEEPGENVNFILIAKNKKNILETITSRCRVTRLGHKKNSDSLNSAKKFIDMEISSKLSVLHRLSGKDETLDFLSTLIEGGHSLLTREGSDHSSLAKIIDSALKTKSEIESNANVTIALTKLSLDLVCLSEKNYN